MPSPRRYLVKELFGPTIQGEGTWAGRACVFLRFAVCNLACSWCDTDFAPAGATRMTAADIASRLTELDRFASRMVVVTGGEPTLQWDAPLARAVESAGFATHMESNGTQPLKAPVTWLAVSPKPQFHEKQHALCRDLAPSEVKVVIDDTVTEATLAGYETTWDCAHWLVQPCDDARYDHHLARAIELALCRPRWRLSLQLHKIAGLP